MEQKESHKIFYDDFIEIQLKKGINHRHISIQTLLIEKGIKKTDNVLEIGCGIGTVTGLISKVVKKGKVTANDISPKSIEVAKKRLHKTKNISYIVGDIISLEIKEKFDVIVLPDVLEHIPMDEHIILFNKLNKLIKKTGWIFIHIPNPFYLDYLVKNTPEKLQELDQPLHLSHLSNVFENTGFFIQELNNYSIYIKENDYQYIILKSTVLKDTFVPISLKKESILTRVLNKIKGIR